MKNETISVIVPVYKVEPYLRECVDSIINQTYKNLEIILVDDGSPDNCGAICDEYAAKDSRVRVIHKENGGVSSARNAGIEAATGDYIGFVDSDDWIEPDMYENLLESLQRENAEIAAPISFYDPSARQSVLSGEQLLRSTFRVITKQPKQFASHGFCCNLYATGIVKETPFDPNMAIGEDFCFWIKICKRVTRCAVCAEMMYRIRFREDSAYGRAPLMVRAAGDYRTILKAIELLADRPDLLPNELQHLIAVSFIYINAAAQKRDKEIFWEVRRELLKHKREIRTIKHSFTVKYQVGLLLLTLTPHLFFQISIFQMTRGKWKDVD